MARARDLEAILRALNKAQGPDEELDARIGICLGKNYRDGTWYGGKKKYGRVLSDGTRVIPGNTGTWLVEPYTSSLTAVTQAIEELLPDWQY